MARKNYRIRFKADTGLGFFVNVARELENLLRVTGAKIEDRRVLKYFRSALYKMPGHVVSKDGIHLWGADLSKPNPGPRGSTAYDWVKNDDGEDITEGFARLDPSWIEKAWEVVLKPKLKDPESSTDLEEVLRCICEDLKLMDAYERVIPPLEDDEEVNEGGDDEDADEDAGTPTDQS